MSILCTRNIATKDLPILAATNMHYDIVPCIQLDYNTDIHTQESVSSLASQDSIVIFTSRAAVHAVRSLVKEIPKKWRIICTAPGTRDLIQEWLGTEKIIHSAINADLIIPYFTTLSKDSKIIVFRSNKSLPTIPNALHLQGFKFETIEVYRNIALNPIVHQEYDYYLFFSPSAVDAFLKNNQIPASKIAIAIGNTTQNHLEKKNIANILTASTPNLSSMLQLIKDYELKK